MPPFQRKTLVLIGAQGVGRRSLKNRFIVLNPTRFGTTVPCKSSAFPLLFDLEGKYMCVSVGGGGWELLLFYSQGISDYANGNERANDTENLAKSTAVLK